MSSDEDNHNYFSGSDDDEEENGYPEEDYDEEDEEVEEEEEEDYDDEEEDYEKAPSKKKSKKSSSKKSKKTPEKRKSKRRKVDGVEKFIAAEASSGEEDEEDLDEVEEGWEDVQKKAEERIRRQRMLYESKGKIKTHTKEAEEMEDVAEEIVSRTKEQAKKERIFRHLGSEEKRVLADAALKPKPTDPRLFRVQCVRGNERIVVSQILNKAFECRIPIYNAFFKSEKVGYIYVEADNRDDVKIALNDIDYLYGLETNLYLVPINDMIPSLDSGHRAETFVRGDIVRIKSGLYKGDIARVHDILSDKEVSAYVVPRIDYAAELKEAKCKRDGEDFIINDNKPAGSKGAKKSDSASSSTSSGKGNGDSKQGMMKKRGGFRRGADRPERCMFNPDLFAELGSTEDGDNNNGVFIYEDGMYKLLNNTYKDGLLLRTFRTTSLKKEGANPTAEEIESITPNTSAGSKKGGSKGGSMGTQSGIGGADESAVKINIGPSTFSAGSARGKGASFRKGDCVMAQKGDFKGVRFTVLETEGTQATVKAIGQEGLKVPITIDMGDLEKSFNDGDHVVVMHGEHKGVTGFVMGTKAKGGLSIVLVKRDGSGEMMREYARDLAASSGAQNEITELHGIKLHDLVRFGDNMYGVVYSISNDRFSVIDTFARDHVLEHRDIKSAFSVSSRNINRGTDRNNNDLSVGDDVLAIDGPQRGSRGKIIHFSRNFAFVKIDTMRIHGGIFPVRCSDLLLSSAAASGQTVAAASAAPGGYGGTRPGQSQQQNYRPRREPPRFKSGTRVLVLKGRSRGKSAIVRYCNGSEVRIETLVDGRQETISADSLRETSASSGSGGRSSSMSSDIDMDRGMYGMDDMSRGGYGSYGEPTPSWPHTPSYQADPFTPSQQTPYMSTYSPGSTASMPVSTPQAFTPSAAPMQQPYSPSGDYSQARTPRY